VTGAFDGCSVRAGADGSEGEVVVDELAKNDALKK